MAILNAKIDPVQATPPVGSDSSAWVAFHRYLKRRYGARTANSMWSLAWKKRGSSAANTHDLRTYMSSQGLEIDAGTFGSIKDSALAVTDGISDIFGDLYGIGKWATIGVLVVVIGGAGFLIYNVVRRPEKYAKIAASAGAAAAKI